MSIKIKQFLLFGGDVVALYLALWLMLFVRFGRIDSLLWSEIVWQFTIVFCLWILIFYLAGMYDLASYKMRLVFYWKLAKSLALSALVAMSFFYIVPYLMADPIAPKRTILIVLGIFGVLNIGWRKLFYKLVQSRGMINNLAIIGTNSKIYEVAKIIKDNPSFGYKLTVIISPNGFETHDPEIKIINTIPESESLKRIFSY